MCRLFAFKSVINSQVHSSLVHAENALAAQSVKHPDGWGVAYYREDTPHLIKSTDRAVDDHIFEKVSGVVSSQTVVAHIRKATQGSLNILNSHPFQYGKWIFAHNGNLKNFTAYKEKLISKISPDLQRFILGTTDSEIIFYLFLTLLNRETKLSNFNVSTTLLARVTKNLCDLITTYSGPLYAGKDNDPKENHITFILTNGNSMIALNGGQDLHFSTHKKKCSERDTCPYFEKSCENQVDKGIKVNHLIVSSEVLKGENIWQGIQKGEFIGVDNKMEFYKEKLLIPFL